MSRTVAITGASAGVGRACAKLFARGGWQVGLVARCRFPLNVGIPHRRDRGFSGPTRGVFAFEGWNRTRQG